MRGIATRSLFVALVIATALASPLVVEAGVDLTGNWAVTYSLGGPPIGTTHFTFVQNVLVLTLTRSDDEGTGSIDPDAGHFTINFGPFTSPLGGPPGPDHVLTGLATLDGESFTAIEDLCLFEPGLGWGCTNVTLNGVRGEPPAPVCGNARVEEGEECDGHGNGSDGCCAADCTLIDPDDDGICSLIDNCPREPNRSQSDQDGDFIGDACDSSTIGVLTGQLEFGRTRVSLKRSEEAGQAMGRLFLSGSYTGELLVPTTIQLRDADAVNLDLGLLPGWTAKECAESTPDRIRCAAPDSSVRITLWRRAENPAVIRFHLAVWNPPIEPTFVQPLIISVHAADGGRRGILFGCRPRDGGGTSCSQPNAALRAVRDGSARNPRSAQGRAGSPRARPGNAAILAAPRASKRGRRPALRGGAREGRLSKLNRWRSAAERASRTARSTRAAWRAG